MLRAAIAAALAAAALGGLGPAAAATARPARAALWLSDPLFGLRVAAARVERAPADLVARCPALETAKWRRRMWMFARAEADERTYLIVAGQFVDRATGRARPDRTGALVSLGDDGCRMIGPPRDVFDYGDDQMTAAALGALARDGAGRYRRAGVSPSALRSRLAAKGVSPILRDAFK